MSVSRMKSVTRLQASARYRLVHQSSDVVELDAQSRLSRTSASIVSKQKRTIIAFDVTRSLTAIWIGGGDVSAGIA